ncbi:hypothetical protein HYALB_00011150 [Hymenoscyphus albidus]|uniref:Uncharacterized protein n=1 Tax=Hymenoscyphus albidus TaxID=595503 RepID=A0A9N9LM01_9HELO|nr:hypothetical protein HYALB_00011150 [Hymenoscyphus albidus]
MAPTPKGVAFAEHPEFLTTPATPTKPASLVGLKPALKPSSSAHVDPEKIPSEDLLSATMFSDLGKHDYPKNGEVLGKLLDNLETRFKEAEEKHAANLGAPTPDPPFTYLSKGGVTYLDVVDNMASAMQQLQLKQQAKTNLLQLIDEEAAAQRAKIDEKLAALRPKLAAATTKFKAAARKRTLAEREKAEAAAKYETIVAGLNAIEAEIEALKSAKLSPKEASGRGGIGECPACGDGVV